MDRVTTVDVMASKDPDEVREIFDHFDRDRSGQIDASEWLDLLGALDADFSPEEAALGLQTVDADHSGTVEFGEFLSWWTGRD